MNTVLKFGLDMSTNKKDIISKNPPTYAVEWEIMDINNYYIKSVF